MNLTPWRNVRNTADSLTLLGKYIKNTLPQVEQEIGRIERFLAATPPCRELAEQALSSIANKKFHCQGGGVYSLYADVSGPGFLRFVVALQTISDYLDNLCDRAGVADEKAFRQLHLAITDALDPAAPLHDYYRFYPAKADGGYLISLVKSCREEIRKLPAYPSVKPYVLQQAALYSELQTYKHLEPLPVREDKMSGWLKLRGTACPDIAPWEFAAAAGSTLGIFALCAAAGRPSLTPGEAQRLASGYFPWINGLHILLDYFIDGAEDQLAGDLNFVAYYTDDRETSDRLVYFLRQSLERARDLPYPAFTTTVIHGLLAMYLSDPKAGSPREHAIARQLLNAAGVYPRIMHQCCRLLRTRGFIQ